VSAPSNCVFTETSSNNFLNTDSITIGSRVYKLQTTLTALNATGTFTETGSNDFVNNDVITIGSHTYTLHTTITGDTASANASFVHIAGSSSFAADLVKLKNCINGSGGTPGTDYKTSAPDANVIASGTGPLTLTAIALGVVGNSIVYTYTAAGTAAGTLSGSGTLTGGSDANVHLGGSFAATVTNLQFAIAGVGGAGGPGTDYNVLSADANVFLVAGSGLFTLTAKLLGLSANSIATTYAASGTSAGSFAHATLTGGVADNTKWSATAHGLHTAEGVYSLSTTGTLPAPFTTTALYWVNKVDANTFQLSAMRGDKMANALEVGTTNEDDFVAATTPGTGVQTLTRAVTLEGLFDLLYRNKAETIVAATDIGTLK
jgi:hypothetical protein